MVRFESDGGAPEGTDGVAPVIALFGGRRATHSSADAPAPTTPARTDTGQDAAGSAAPIDLVPRWRSTWHDDRAATASARDARVAADLGDDGDTVADAAEQIASAERMLLKKLRTRQLSVSEARSALVAYELPADAVEQLIDDCLRRGYLDDARLAEQLIHTGSERKGQGRRAIAQTLSGRGIPRDVIDEAMAEQPDDDAERALEFARTKARQLSHVDEAAALRRLMGQLSRRGYPGSVAATAARAALAENRSGGGGGVRFR